MATNQTVLTRRTTHARSRLTAGMLLIGAIAIARFFFHLYFNNRYGYFRDEFDYIACGDHLAWGYVDQPPLIPFLIHLSRAVLGDSLRAIRFIPAVATSLLVVQAALIARELGGKTYAMVLTAVTILIAPQYLSNGSLLTTNCLEPNLWMASAYFIILAIKRDQPRHWFWVGVFAGIGLEEKYSIAFFVIGIVVGLLVTKQRRALLNKWIWIGAAAGLVIVLPNVLWNMHHGWPFLQLMHNIRGNGRDVVLPAGEYFFQQMILIHPLTAPIWMAGLIAFLVHPRLKQYRILGVSYLVCYAIFFGLHGKVYYLAPIYPMLLAAGAVLVEFAFNRPRFGWLKPAVVVILLLSGAHIAPLVVPVLRPDGFRSYLRYLPIKPPVMERAHAGLPLPQWYADQFGWNEIVAETAEAWSQIPPAERGDCAIFAQNYGQAGAIDFLGPKYGLPRSLSGHQTWWLWGPRDYSGNCMIVLDDTQASLEKHFREVRLVGFSPDNPNAWERHIPVFICRGANFKLSEIWPKLKHWS
jgi:dolichyl-phosphate-mannose-protein mannosyltransferase